MKKGTSISIVVILFLVLLPMTAFAGYSLTPKIMAGQTEHVGYVRITGNADGSLTLTYILRGGGVQGWCVTDSAVHVGLTLADFPQNNGGAIPGQFDYQYGFGGCVTRAAVTIPDPVGDKGDIYIAIHVNVYGPDGQQETGWVAPCGNIADHQFPGNNWSAWTLFPAEAWY